MCPCYEATWGHWFKEALDKIMLSLIKDFLDSQERLNDDIVYLFLTLVCANLNANSSVYKLILSQHGEPMYAHEVTMFAGFSYW